MMLHFPGIQRIGGARLGRFPFIYSAWRHLAPAGRKHLRSAALVLLLQSITVSTNAATVSWVGGTGDWATPANWSTGLLPGTNDDVVINPADPAAIITHGSGAHTIQSLTSQRAFQLTGGSLTVSNTVQINNDFTLAGGTLIRATVLQGANNGTSVVSGGKLDGVTVNGMLDVGNAYGGGATLTVTNGMVLNGTMLVGNPTNATYGTINFAGTQSLTGNGSVIFGNYSSLPGNSLRLVNTGTTLTIGSGITIRGDTGYVGYNFYVGPPANVSVINQGTISADVSGGTITINAQPIVNQGVLKSPVGSLVLAGTISGLGAIQSGNGPLTLSGILTNTGLNQVFNGSTNTLTLVGGTILGGSITATNGAALVVQSGKLDGVTVNGMLDVGNAYGGGATLTVTNGMVLNGTMLVGNPTNATYGTINFAGTQSLTGNGSVIFGNYSSLPGNSLRLVNTGTTLTIGSGITIRGDTGYVGYNFYVGPPANVSVINQGTISADVSGGTITINAQPFVNQGTLRFVISDLTSFGQIKFAGNQAIDGTLDVIFANGFIPPASSSFPLITYGSHTGAFISSNLPTSAAWQIDYGATAVTLRVLTTLSVSIQGRGVVERIPDKPFYQIGESVTLNARPLRYYSFSSWSDGVTSSNRTVTIVPTNIYTAIFTNVVPLETLTIGGTTRTAPLGTPLVLLDGQYYSNNIVTTTNGASFQVTLQSSFTNATQCRSLK